MSEEKLPANIPGRQVILPSALAAILLALLFGGVSPSPKRYLYEEPGSTGHATPDSVENPATLQAPEGWLLDPLAVCTECHTTQEAEQFRKVLGPMLAAATGSGWVIPDPSYQMLPAPLPPTLSAAATMVTPDAALAGTK